MTDVSVAAANLTEYATSALVVAVASGEAPLSEAATTLDRALDGAIAHLRDSGEFKAKVGDVLMLHTLGRLSAERILIVGVGEAGKLTAADVRRIAGIAARAVRKAGLATYSSTLYGHDALGATAAAQSIVEGSLLGLYRFDRYRKSDLAAVDHLALVPEDYLDHSLIDEGVRRGRAIAEGVSFARDLINEPPNILTPTELVRRAREMANAHNLECETFDEATMREMGMEALLGVASGSDEPPGFVVIRYGHEHTARPPIALVGKGITFDSGGISIKPAADMHQMKGDMGGAAAVLGTMRIIATLKPPVAVTAIVPTTENLLGGKAQVPGDIVRALNGVSIEIINTDAEGRLILADALSYATREGYRPIVDVATLTGAASVAIGPFYSAVFANDDGLAAETLASAERAGEKIWRMPLDKDYEELIKSDHADIKNSAGRAGGAITAAMFLQHFVDDAAPWAHFDIAPNSWSDKDEGEQTKGGAGVATRTLVALVERLATS